MPNSASVEPIIVPKYIVTMTTPKGTFEVTVPTFQGSDAAGRRAFFTLAGAGYGDLDTLHIVSIIPEVSNK